MWRSWGKRWFDVAASALGLVGLSPLLLFTAILVRIKHGAPVVFRQERPGRDQKPFLIYKFRTMTEDRDSTGALLPDSARLTRFGAWLRSTSFDEFPELLNVLKGDMSLVGPRPLLMRYTPYFSDEELARFSVRPGITGLAQIAGRNLVSWDERIRTDLKYVETCSMTTDLRILFLTFWQVIKREGIVVDARAGMLNFDEERRQRQAATAQERRK